MSQTVPTTLCSDQFESQVNGVNNSGNTDIFHFISDGTVVSWIDWQGFPGGNLNQGGGGGGGTKVFVNGVEVDDPNFEAGTNVTLTVASNDVIISASNSSSSPVNSSLDIQNFGSSGPKDHGFEQLQAAATTVSGSPLVAIASSPLSAALTNGQGVCIWKAGAATAQSTPAAPTATCPNMAGSQTIRYQCVGYDVHGGLTAASSLGSTIVAPDVFGPVPVQISSISASADIVTVNFTGPLNTTVVAGMTIHIINVTGSGASWNGIFTIATAPTTSQITYALAGALGTGTISSTSTGRLSNTAIITSIYRDTSGKITITLATSPQWTKQSGLNPTIVTVENVFPLDLQGTYVISTISGNVVTCANTGILKNSVGIATGGVSMNATVWEFATVACPALAGTTLGYYVYSDSPSPGGALVLIGKVLYGERHFTDWGPCVMAGYRAPAYVPTTPPASAQNQMFSTTIISGGGTTNLFLASNVPTSIPAFGATIMFDDGPNLLACIAAAQPTVNQGIAGSVFLSPARTEILFPAYIFNSYVPFTQGITISFGARCFINETFQFFQANDINTLFGTTTFIIPTFGSKAYCDVSGAANPIFLFGTTPGGGESGFSIDGLAFTLNGNGRVGVEVYNNTSYMPITNCYFQSSVENGGDTNVGIVFNGAGNGSYLANISVNFFNRFYNDNVPIKGQSNVGPPIGGMVLRGSDNPNIDADVAAIFSMYESNNWSGRGILIDEKYSPNPSTRTFYFGDEIWNQAPITPFVMLWGQEFNDITLARVTNDSNPAAVVGNWCTDTYNVVLDNCNTNPTNTITTGYAIQGLEQRGAQSVWQNSSVLQHLTGSKTFITNSGTASAATLFAEPILLGSSGIMAIPYVPNNAQMAVDNFTRINENPLTNAGNWSALGTTLQLLSDVCVPTATNTLCSDIWTGITWSADQYSELTVGNWTNDGNNTLYLYVRVTGTSGYRLDIASGGSSMALNKIVSGTPTLLATGGQVQIPGTIVRLTVRGNLITATQTAPGNLTSFSAISFTDTTFTSGSPGIGAKAVSNIALAPISYWDAGFTVPVVVQAVGGGGLTAQAWSVQIAYVGFDGGVSAPTDPISVTTTSFDASIQINWGVLNGVKGVNVYLNQDLQNSSPFTGTTATITFFTVLGNVSTGDGTGLPCIYPNTVLTPIIVMPTIGPSGGNNESTISAPSLSANRTITVPDASGTCLVGSATAIGNGASAGINAPALGTGAGPATPGTIVGWTEINIGGNLYWIPLSQ